MHDEILKLKQLLDQGVLTEEEFAAAKRKLLGMDGSVQQAKEASDPKPIAKPVSPSSKSGFAPAPYKEESRPAYVSQAKSTKECPKCHEPIPLSAMVCPACGSSVSNLNRSSKECPRCHRKYSLSASECPFCTDKKEKKPGSIKFHSIVFGVVFVLLVWLVTYVIEYNKNFDSTVTYTASQTSSIAAQSLTSTPKKANTTKPVATPTATPKPTDPWPSLDASSVKYNYANSVGKNFYLEGYAELDDYYNWAYDDYEKDFFCMRVKPEGKYSSDAWYIYFRRTSFKKLYDDALKYGSVTVELTCNITAYEKGQNNMAQALRVSWWH